MGIIFCIPFPYYSHLHRLVQPKNSGWPVAPAVKKGGLLDKCPVEGYSETRADSQAAPPLGTIQF